MRIDIVTLFPEMCAAVSDESIVGRARKKGFLQLCTHQLRDFAYDKHNKVDDVPFGGGKGMLLKPEPISACLDSIMEHLGVKPHIIYMSPIGSVLNQEKVKELSSMNNLLILCGHYEGIDERIIDEYVDEQISIGDFVVTGGELPALILADSVSRMISGVLADDVCFKDESHFSGLLEYPQYTRPAVWNNLSVPEALVSGDHARVATWKRQSSLKRTHELRPDMINYSLLCQEDKIYLDSIK